VHLGSIINPTIVRPGYSDLEGSWELNYSEQAASRLISTRGSVTLYGTHSIYRLEDTAKPRLRVLPPSLEVAAAEDILLKDSFTLAPSTSGSLRLFAGRDLDGGYITTSSTGVSKTNRAAIGMSDVDPSSVYGFHQQAPLGDLFLRTKHGSGPLHRDDTEHSQIEAGQDIKNIEIYLAEQAMIHAGRDVQDLYLTSQNTRSSDVTSLVAGMDIVLSPITRDKVNAGIEHAGPGVLLVQALNNIDLGRSSGIQTVGNSFNPSLGTKGSDLIMSAGYAASFSLEKVAQFFGELRRAGTNYSKYLAAGETGLAQEAIREAREGLIQPFLEATRTGKGRINMTLSQVSTVSGKDDIFMMAGGSFGVGKSAFIEDAERQTTGIYTSAGGAINIFSEKDLNVNESRVMTYRGGDITVWSNFGNVNAGRGSKTAINAEPPRLKELPDGSYVLEFRPPAVGSGIRTLTYDPDGFDGPELEPNAGDAYIFAPQGIIDAGEAGIAGRNVILGATEVLNVQNISFALGAVGVPQTGGAGPSIGALAGAGSVSETAKIAQESSSLKSAEERMAKFTEELNKNLVPKIIMVEVLGFEEEKVN
jgi:hypothetical protein